MQQPISNSGCGGSEGDHDEAAYSVQNQSQNQNQNQKQQARNFRENYYSSLGFHVLEVKPTLENAFAGDILDLDKLAKMCLWVRIPHLYRPLVWKVLLGILPTSKTSWDYVSNQLHDQFQDLKRCALLIYPSTRTTTTSRTTYDEFISAYKTIELNPDLMIKMLLIQINRMNPLKQLIPHPNSTFENLKPIASCLLNICRDSTKNDSSTNDDDDENENEDNDDAFWLFTFFVKTQILSSSYNNGGVIVDDDDDEIRNSQQKRTSESINNLKKLLQQENYDLFMRLNNLNVDLKEGCERWFENYFAEVLPPESLERIWDVLFGGAPAILDYVALCLILAVQRQIQAANSLQQVYNLFKVDGISNYVNHQAVVSSAIDLWEKPILENMSSSSSSSS